MNYEQEKITL